MQPGMKVKLVAQSCTLLYRRIVFCRAAKTFTASVRQQEPAYKQACLAQLQWTAVAKRGFSKGLDPMSDTVSQRQMQAVMR